ncbi:hypothetical protein XFF6166_920143 [Xanthomonas citri pv. fuscans]|nr:hypothetical protein XFF6166_920143 [Xanthomonas citri pv. fuscans]SOO03599.1 hypothetical protein XFF6960_880023 [Xanthomonas citri pv. fuscans]SOO04908.1 hypothetical protein XFF7767_330023 [Xanthomonas citri pv. fuscans]SOO09842.1 hypothetical protein XFF6970_480023 [Xanthomonas citri pv. fuscans]SOO12787.1 hypothetical protein XFF7766_1130145 [Xanthomonas citri pv. fuscans]
MGAGAALRGLRQAEVCHSVAFFATGRATDLISGRNRVRDTKDLQTELRHQFDTRVVEAVAAVVDSENGTGQQLRRACARSIGCALPAAGRHPGAAVAPACVQGPRNVGRRFDQILRLRPTGLKASANNELVLRRLLPARSP